MENWKNGKLEYWNNGNTKPAYRQMPAAVKPAGRRETRNSKLNKPETQST